MDTNEKLSDLASKFKQGRITRREFLMSALVLGVSTTTVSGLLAACSSSPNPAPTAAPAAPPAPTAAAAPTAAQPAATAAAAAPASTELSGNVTVWGWANDMLRATGEAFNKLHPNVKLNFVDMSWQDTHQKLSVALAAGSGAPDVLSIDGAQMQHFVTLGGLLDITEEMTPHLKDFPDYKIREASDAKGKIYAVPWDVGPLSLFYRKDIFEKFSIQPPVTWDEFISSGQKLAAQGHYMMGFSLATPNPQDFSFFQKLLWQAGGSYFDPKTGAVTLDNDKGLQAMEMYARIIFAGITVDIAPFTPAYFGAWKDGTIVTDPGAAWMLHVFPDNIKSGDGGYGQWRVADQLPAFEKGGTPTSNLGGSNVVVTGQTKNRNAAVAYALYTCASADGQIIMGNKGTFPGFLPSYKDPRMADATNGVYGDQKFNQPFIKLSSLVPNSYWRDAAFPIADALVNAGLPNVHSKKWAPKDAVKALADQIRAATLR